jgi:alpha-L-fucosidase 2
VGGIVGNLYYNYALFNDDSKFLKTRALPFMREVALFYEDFFKLGKDGFYISSPSYSPNTNPGNFAVEGEDARVEIAINATVDFAIAKELLTNLIAGSLSSGLNKNDVAKWQDMLTKIPKYEINSDKVVKEYLSPKFNDNYNSEKISHLYAAYPGTEINTLSTDSELPRAFINAAKKRLSNGIKEQTSSSLGNIASLFARLGEGDAAADCLSMILRSAVMSNMVTAETDWRGMGIGRDTAWASYHIQGNMIFANVVQDMLLASTEKTIKIFPSFYDGWNKLDVSGMQTRAGVEVGLSYKEKSGSLIITLKAKRSTKIDLHFPAGTKRIVRGVNIEGFNLEQLVLSGVELSTKPTVFEVKYTPAARKF